MEREQIDKEYGELCLKYGDISQKILHLEDQENKALEALESQKTQLEKSYVAARLPLRKELKAIEDRWVELKKMVTELESSVQTTPGE